MLLSKIGESKPKAMGALVTLSLVALLILAGPANALTVSINSPGKKPFEQGKDIDIKGQIKIEDNEILNKLQFVTVKIEGPSNRTCNFTLNQKDDDDEEDDNETLVSDCPGVEFEVEKNKADDFGYGYGYFVGEGYGYGYGFTDGKIKYEIEIDTALFEAGEYTIVVEAAGESSKTRDFVIVGVCKDVVFRSKGYFDNHESQWAALLPQTLGGEVVTTTDRVNSIFDRKTKVDKVKAPLLAIRFNLQNFPEAENFTAIGESITVGALADEADALLLSANPTTLQLTLMKDRLERQSGIRQTCPNDHSDDEDDD